MKQRSVQWMSGLLFAVAFAVSPAAAVQIQDVIRLKGSETNKIIGMGLVVGLNGTGDGGKFLPAMRPLAQMIGRFIDPNTSAPDLKDGKSVALVSVTAELPANGVREGDLIDVSISTVGPAKSLVGGRLFMVPLIGPTPDTDMIFAFAEGAVSIEDPDNPTEIVVHVNMLKEGWDVTNLYTIVPLRAANSRTLVEQSIGRGLRLPYGRRTGVAAVDRLTIVSHDRFQEIIDEANKPDSIIRTGVVIGKDIPDEKAKVVVVESEIENRISPKADGDGKTQPGLFEKPEEQKVAKVTLKIIKQYERLTRSSDLTSPKIMKEIVEKVEAEVAPVQAELEGIGEKVDVETVVRKTVEAHNELTIDIPRIIVVPKGEVVCGYNDFDLDLSNVRLQPVDNDILVQHLHDQTQHRLISGDGIVAEQRLENYLVRGLIDFDDISYDDHAEFLYKLCGQMVAHLQSYLSNEDDVLNVLQYHQQSLVNLIHSQMQEHYEESAAEYEAIVSKGFRTLTPNTFSILDGEEVRNFRTPVEDRLMIRGMVFGGFSKCLYPQQKFDADSERRFSVILENDGNVLKWLKPARRFFEIDYRYDGRDAPYEPDFVVETENALYLCEPKRASEVNDDEVQAKAQAAAVWCKHATAVAAKPWSYLLIPHDAITDNKTMQGLASAYTFSLRT
ncbi:MAG: flagellar basal body P-ring protein FlgI [Acidobacteria bacterium]|nr:flagellar basal body P-ring protein FlgI [Acidobacteriota bacterium]